MNIHCMCVYESSLLAAVVASQHEIEYIEDGPKN